MKSVKSNQIKQFEIFLDIQVTMSKCCDVFDSYKSAYYMFCMWMKSLESNQIEQDGRGLCLPVSYQGAWVWEKIWTVHKKNIFWEKVWTVHKKNIFWE